MSRLGFLEMSVTQSHVYDKRITHGVSAQAQTKEQVLWMSLVRHLGIFMFIVF